jgi:hypothetical protein
MSDARLDQFDKDEWRDVTRIRCPNWTEADFKREWAEFQRIKAARTAN